MASLGYLQVVCYVTSLNNKKKERKKQRQGCITGSQTCVGWLPIMLFKEKFVLTTPDQQIKVLLG